MKTPSAVLILILATATLPVLAQDRAPVAGTGEVDPEAATCALPEAGFSPRAKLPPVAVSLSGDGAVWTTSSGSLEPIEVSEDLDFDPEGRALCHGRVLQLPAPRWSEHETRRYGLHLSPAVVLALQERAFTH